MGRRSAHPDRAGDAARRALANLGGRCRYTGPAGTSPDSIAARVRPSPNRTPPGGLADRGARRQLRDDQRLEVVHVGGHRPGAGLG